MQFLIFLLFIPVFWVLILRPQQMQRRAHQAVVASLAVGDEVMTVGGLIGTLTEVGPELVRLDTGDGHELTFGRTFVRSLVPATQIEATQPDLPSAPGEHPIDDDEANGRPGGMTS